MISLKKLSFFIMLYVVIQFSLIVSPTVEASEAGQFNPIRLQAGFFGPSFGGIMGMDIDKDGNIYVVDHYTHTVWKFDSDGNYLKDWYNADPNLNIDPFHRPACIAVDAAGNMYITDYDNHRIQKFASDDTWIKSWGKYGKGNGQFDYSWGITIDSAGYVYVADARNNRVQKFTSDGTYITQFGGLSEPLYVAIDKDGNVYTTNRDYYSDNQWVQKYKADGTFLTQWTGDFKEVAGIVIDAEGNVYVADAGNHSIKKFTSNGEYLTEWGGFGTGNGQFNYPTDLAMDSAGNIYVTDTRNKRVQKMTPLPSTATLSSLTVNTGTLNPAFSSTRDNYSINVAHHVSTLTITAKAEDALAKINAEGKTPATGTLSEQVDLEVGNNTIPIIVTAQDGHSKKTYTLTVKRAPSTDATLKSLTLDHGTLSPAFSASREAYTVQVAHTVSALQITALTTNNGASTTINGSKKTTETVSLVAGQTKTIPIVVTAQDGNTKKTYTLTVTRAISTDATLKSLTTSSGTVSPLFTPNEENYTVQVDTSVTTVDVAAITTDSQASFTINGKQTTEETISLAAGQTKIIPIVVTAQDGKTTKTYTLTVTRAPSSDATLKSLTTSSGTVSPLFTPNEENYTVQVDTSVTTVDVAAITMDSQASFTINGKQTIEETISLAAGQTKIIPIVVTAQDGKTTKTYTLTVTRAPSSDATLQSLTVSNGTLSPAFTANEETYTVQVEHHVTTVDVAAITTDNQASLTINGKHTTAETVTLVAGQAVSIPLVVTAQDGIIQKTYTVMIARAPSSDATLQSLVVDNGILSPSFQPTTTIYTVQPAIAASTLQVTALPTNMDASVMINGHPTTADTITLTMSQPMTIPIIVTAQNGEQSVYTLLVQETIIPVASVMIQPTQLRLQVGEHPVALTATVYPINASNQRVSWRSNNPSVATVDEQGRVTPKSAGQAEIDVTTVDGGQTATAFITVEQVVVGNESTPSPAPMEEPTSGNNPSPPTSMTITFYTNGGTMLEPIKVAYHTKISDLPVPTREGYQFEGWYQDEAFTIPWAEDVLVRGDLALYAKWIALPAEELEAPKESQPKPSIVTFRDIEKHWAQEMIEALATQGIIQGYEDGTFRPNESISRQHVAALITRAFSFESVRTTDDFSDVPPMNPYYEAIRTLQQAGMIDGTEEGMFLPTEKMTRAQLAKVLVGMMELTPEGTTSFSDVSSDHWGAGYIATLEREGIALGDNGYFYPNKPVTRAQFVTFLYRIMYMQ
ncbi:cadherin-like beta sandwich domain-containing protein [Lysinibacillus sp. FSL H8-0500]|uniref:cadherin-like beta sandwich domain-containing protein n=1 Tax=Lysinibacillus sp. FSL H8-0500 TaxID=2921393 RepID=UPI003100D1D9